MDKQIIKHDEKLYAISKSVEEREFIIIQAKPLPMNKKIIESLRIINADDLNHVKRIIRNGEIKNYPIL